MKCRYSEADVALYIEGDLPASKALEIEAHFVTCSPCRDLAAELRESQAVFKSLRREPISPAVLSCVRSQVLAQLRDAGMRPAWGRWVYGIAGAVFLAVVCVGLVMFVQRPAAPDRPQLVKSDIPLVGEGGASEPSAGEARSNAEDRVVEQTSPSVAAGPIRAPRHVAKHAHPSAAEEEHIVNNEVPPEPPKQVTVKLLTDDPTVVIYWLVDQNGGAL